MPDMRLVEQRRDGYDDPKVGPLSSDRRLIESRTQSTAAEPGVRPNTGANIATGGASGSQLTDESSRERTESVFGRDAEHIKDRKGNALKINVSILIPRMYFVALYRLNRNDAEAVPTPVALDPLVNTETARIKAMVEPLIDTAPYPGAQAGSVVVPRRKNVRSSWQPGCVRLKPEITKRSSGLSNDTIAAEKRDK